MNNCQCGRTGFHHVQASQVWRCGLSSWTTRTQRKDWLQEENGALCSLQEEVIQARQGKSNTYVHLACKQDAPKSIICFLCSLELSGKDGPWVNRQEGLCREQVISTCVVPAHTPPTGPPEEIDAQETKTKRFTWARFISSSVISRVFTRSSLQIVHFSAWRSESYSHEHLLSTVLIDKVWVKMSHWCSGSHWDPQILSVCTVRNRNSTINTRNRT